MPREYLNIDFVDVPMAMLRETNFASRVPAWQLAEAVRKMIGAPHLDLDNPAIEKLMCEMAHSAAELRYGGAALPEVEAIEADAAALVEDFDMFETYAMVRSLNLGDREIRCQAKDVETAVRQLVVRELKRLMLRAATPPPKRKRQPRHAA